MSRKEIDISTEVANLVDDAELRVAVNRLNSNRKKQIRVLPAALKEQEPVLDVESGNDATVVGEKRAAFESSVKETASPITKARRAQQTQSSAPQRSRATAILNTRIPPELDDLLDDLISKRRKAWKSSGRISDEPTKQAIVSEALELLFSKFTS